MDTAGRKKLKKWVFASLHTKDMHAYIYFIYNYMCLFNKQIVDSRRKRENDIYKY